MTSLSTAHPSGAVSILAVVTLLILLLLTLVATPAA
jgi:hypothetical protein